MKHRHYTLWTTKTHKTEYLFCVAFYVSFNLDFSLDDATTGTNMNLQKTGFMDTFKKGESGV